MILPSEKFEKIARDYGDAPSTPYRNATHFVHLNADKKRFEASDGRILAVVPVLPEDFETLEDLLVDPEVFAFARKAKAARKNPAVLRKNGHDQWLNADSAAIPAAVDFGIGSDGKPNPPPAWPDADAVVPRPGNRPPDFIFNPRLLLQLLEALSPDTKQESGHVGLAIWFARKNAADGGPGTIDFSSAMYCEAANGTGAYGVAMPMPLESKNGAPILQTPRIYSQDKQPRSSAAPGACEIPKPRATP